MRPATQKGGILFVNHVAACNGAAMMLLHLLRWLKRNGDRPFSTLFVGGGELEAEFAAASDTWVASEGRWCPGARYMFEVNLAEHPPVDGFFSGIGTMTAVRSSGTFTTSSTPPIYFHATAAFQPSRM